MPVWTLETTDGRYRTFTRPLGSTELGFYWDSQLNNTADVFQQAFVDSTFKEICSQPNISRAWLELKQCFPLLGAEIFFGKDSVGRFRVSERCLSELTPSEINYCEVDSQEAAESFSEDWMNDKIPIPISKLSQLIFLTRADSPTAYTVIFRAAHCIADGMSNISLLRNFLHILTSPARLTKLDVVRRLSMAPSLNDLTPVKRLSLSRQRWRLAIAAVMVSKQSSDLKGGHTLPRTASTSSVYTPGTSRAIDVSFPTNISANVLKNCRQNGIRFGNAHAIIGQVALARVLFRRRLRGEIGDEEWEFRKREPQHIGGPLNLRPYLDQRWYNNGGGGELNLCISYFSLTLPYMPLGAASSPKWGQKMPEYSDLLSRERFIWRCQLAKQKVDRFMRHPLFFEMAEARMQLRIEHIRGLVKQWQALDGAAIPKGVKLSAMDQAREGRVLAYGGSSIGDIGWLIPRNYPVDKDNILSPHSTIPHPFKADAPYSSLEIESFPPTGAPLLYLQHQDQKLHCRPLEFYFGAASTGDQLRMTLFWDANVYDEDVIREWLGETQKATEWYLGYNPLHGELGVPKL